MKRSAALGLVALLAGVLGQLAGCGEVAGPWDKNKGWTATPVPADFAIVLDESADTYYARQDIRQVVSITDLMSKTTYSSRRDYNNTVATEFTQDHPMNQAQLQAMWNEVTKYDLMDGGTMWYFWKSNADNYRRSEHVIQIRADGKTVKFTTLNHWGFKLRDLALLIEAVRFPVADGSGVEIITATQPATQPVEAAPATQAVEPAAATAAATGPATEP